MESSSRRAFLRGRRAPASPWEAFVQQMRQAVEGSFHELAASDGGLGAARLSPRQAADVHHARRLCAEYGVCLALDSVMRGPSPAGRSVLWVEPGLDMGVCERLQPDGPAWFVQPGVLLGQLDALDLAGFSDMPCHISVASWLADRALCDWGTGQTCLSGITHLSLLLADGSSAVLGPFGVRQEAPLANATQRRLVSSLFELAAAQPALGCLDSPRWPGRYRLDALRPRDGMTVNLAHLLAGHGGDLGWIEWVVLDERLLGQQGQGMGDGFTLWRGADDPAQRAAGQALDARIKSLFDPSGLFPSSALFQQSRFEG